jgi:endonuclease G
MAFAGYLKTPQIQALVLAAIESGLVLVPRDLLLAGIPVGFAGSLPIRANPNDQFQTDIVAINAVERMADGLVPLVQYLQNAAFQLKTRGRAEAAAFEQAANLIGNVSTGVPALPDPATLPEIVKNEQIVGDDDTLDISFFGEGVEFAKLVARINVPRFENGVQVTAQNGGPWILHGTAWIVGPGLALTNHHVVNARRDDESPASPADLKLQAEAATLEFGFDQPKASPLRVGVQRLLTTSTALDYALLEVPDAPAVGVPTLLAGKVKLDATTRMAVNIIQHPRGEAKQVAFRNNLVAAADDDTIRYYTDTDFGSSGSPVCDDQWRVVALHRGARHAPGANYQGKAEAYVNYGSQIQAILADLRVTQPAAATTIEEAQPEQ